MVGTLVVQNLQGPAAGANANKIIVPAGQVLDASAGFVAPAGSVIQVVNSAINTQFATTSTSYVSTGFSASITPTSSTSKILVIYGCGGVESSVAGGSKGNIQIWKGGSDIFTVSNSILYGSQGSAGPSASFFDTPATTSAVTYTLYFSSNVGTFYIGTNTSSNTITLMEIAG